MSEKPVKRRVPMGRTLALLVGVCVAVIVPFVLFEEPIERFFAGFQSMGGQAQWVTASILFGALALDIFLPIPSSLVSTLCGMLLGTWGGWALSFMAMNVSAAIGYWLGACCAGRARRLIGAEEGQALEGFFARYGAVVLVGLRAVPVLAEASAVFAGLGRLGVGRSALWLGLGNALVSLVYAIVGAWGGSMDAMLPAFALSMIVSGALMGAGAWAAKRTKSL